MLVASSDKGVVIGNHPIQVSNSGTNSIPHELRSDVGFEAILDLDARRLMIDAIDAIEVIEARQVIELAVVRLAALRRTEAELQRLHWLVLGMRESRDMPVAFAEFDFALHVTLSNAARNSLLAARLGAFHEAMREMMKGFATMAKTENRMDALVESHVRASNRDRAAAIATIGHVNRTSGAAVRHA